MEIRIKISDTMDTAVGLGRTQENRTVRVPMAYRRKHNLSIGEFVCFRQRVGRVEVLQVQEAYFDDANEDNECAYITSVNAEKLLIRLEGMQELSRIENITLGCDPETILMDRFTGNLVAACRFLRKNGEVGCDGVLLEFRPPPSQDVNVVTESIWHLIQRARQILNQHEEGRRTMMLGRSSYERTTAGFHLHYGLPHGLLGNRSESRQTASLMTRVFDYYVGVPSIIPEGNHDIGRRSCQYLNYGKPGEFRLDNRTFEFRMPGGANLKHPLLTRGLMSLGAVVAEDVASRVNTCTDFFSNMKEMGSDSDLLQLYPNLPNGKTYYDIVCNPDIGLAMSHLRGIRRDVRRMAGYEKRMVAVEDYFKHIEQDFSNDVEQNWREFYAKQQRQMAVS